MAYLGRDARSGAGAVLCAVDTWTGYLQVGYNDIARTIDHLMSVSTKGVIKAKAWLAHYVREYIHMT